MKIPILTQKVKTTVNKSVDSRGVKSVKVLINQYGKLIN